MRFMEQAISEARGQIPIVVLKEERSDWCIMIRWNDVWAFMEELNKELTSAKDAEQSSR